MEKVSRFPASGLDSWSWYQTSTAEQNIFHLSFIISHFSLGKRSGVLAMKSVRPESWDLSLET